MVMAAVEFVKPASEATLEALAERLRARNFEVVILDDGAAAKAEVLARVPEGSQVHTGKSKTLEDIGIFQEFMENEKYDFIRRRTLKMDRKTQLDEMRKAGAAPDIMVNSAHAVTEAGQIVMTSATGSQIGPIAYGAGKLILVIGSQKVVPDLNTALRRIEDYVIPYEEDRLNVAHGVAKMNRTLILEGDYAPGRTTVILVRTPIGV
jgi:acyl-CoA hydrolase